MSNQQEYNQGNNVMSEDNIFIESVSRLRIKSDEILVVKVPPRILIQVGDKLKAIHKEAGWKFKLLILPKNFDLEVTSV